MLRFALFIATMMLSGSISSVFAAEQNQRLSFAISGGASKGAYEAGLNWAGLTILRHVGEKDDPVLSGRFRPFEAVSIAGASAGGINTLLSGLTWCVKPENQGGFPNTINDNLFRSAWLHPDINYLLPGDPQSALYLKDDALLARTGLVEISEYLRSHWNAPVYRQDCRIPLGVTVTRISPEHIRIGNVSVQNQRFTIPFEIRVNRDSRVEFYFNPRDYSSLLDYSMILLPYDSATSPYRIKDQRIQNAVLTSASYPFAFGRKRLKFCRLKALYEYEDHGRKVDGDGLLCPPGYELSEAEFADGGLFDNLPIGLARTLAEESDRAKENPFPVTYVYIDPNRLRYKKTEEAEGSACKGTNPPAACRQMEYSLLSESNLLVEAFGTARNYELYRELTSESWSYNLTHLSQEIAGLLEQSDKKFSCRELLPYYSSSMSCAQALRLAGRLLTTSFNRTYAPIIEPFDEAKLRSAGIARQCRTVRSSSQMEVSKECRIDYRKFRAKLAASMLKIIERMPDKSTALVHRVQNARMSIHNDRVIRITSRGTPITSELLGAFAAFLEYEFREYDYYAGIYDAIVIFSSTVCEHHFLKDVQAEELNVCRDAMAEHFYHSLQLDKNKKARYVFAQLSRLEFGKSGAMQFAYLPMPETDKNMKIIFDGLQSSQRARQQKVLGLGSTSAEKQFFIYLKQQGFKPTITRRGHRPLLAEILDDPDYWSFELTRRLTDRLMVLEQESNKIITARNPEGDKSELSTSMIIGGASYALRTATYKYQGFAFAPSTAPQRWFWRNVIPYEISLDLVEGRGHVVWQPTLALSKDHLIGSRISLPITGNFVTNSPRLNYASLELDYTWMSGKKLFSSYGVAGGLYHTYYSDNSPSQDSVGMDMHMGVLSNRFRLALGMRDYNDPQNSWFIRIGVTDLPGMVYWFTR